MQPVMIESITMDEQTQKVPKPQSDKLPILLEIHNLCYGVEEDPLLSTFSLL